MFDPKIKVSKALHDKIRVASQILGSASIEEFVEKILDTECEKIINVGASNKEMSKEEIDNIASQLKGLGYLD